MVMCRVYTSNSVMSGEMLVIIGNYVGIHTYIVLYVRSFNVSCVCIRDQPIMLIFYLLYYAAVLIKFIYYAQNYAQE